MINCKNNKLYGLRIIHERSNKLFHVNIYFLVSSAAVLSYKGYHDEARQTREDHVLNIYRTHLGDNHPFTATLLNCVGNDYQSLGEIDTAEALFREALDTRRTYLGENHQETARSYHDLGKCLAKKKEYQEALKMLSTALEIQQWVGDIPHEEIITRQDILSIHEILGEAQEEETMQGQLQICERRVSKVGRHGSFNQRKVNDSDKQ